MEPDCKILLSLHVKEPHLGKKKRKKEEKKNIPCLEMSGIGAAQRQLALYC